MTIVTYNKEICENIGSFAFKNIAKPNFNVPDKFFDKELKVFDFDGVCFCVKGYNIPICFVKAIKEW